MAASRVRSNDGDSDESSDDELFNSIASGKKLGFPLNKDYLPEDRFRELVNRKSIKSHLPAPVDEDFLDFASKDAPRIFAIVLCCGFARQPGRISNALKKCRQHGITDADLPMPGRAEKCNSATSENRHECTCRWHALAAEPGSMWKSGNWDNFRNKQWQFLGPKFDAQKFEYKLHDQHVLPIFCGEAHKKAQGHFSDVVEGYLHPEHAQGFPWVGQQGRVALKKFRDAPENIVAGMAARDAFQQEAKTLKELRRQKHPNIVQQMAAIELGQQYYLLSPWAGGGDLRQFWKENEKPALDGALIMEILQQLQGIAEAIDGMHSGNWEGSRSRRSSRSPSFRESPSKDVHSSEETGEGHVRLLHDNNDYVKERTMEPVPSIIADGDLQDASESHGANTNPNLRHGDLKPENILVFPKFNTTLGVLCVSDLGLAKRHTQATSLRKIPSSSKFGTQAYEPPEIIKTKAPRSRLYDIWSFGCIMLEFITWLLYGLEGLERFEDFELPAREVGTLFWTLQGPESAKLNDRVTYLMKRILKHDPKCTGQSGFSAVCDLLLLVRDHALVVALPGSSTAGPTRADAAGLADKLEEIIEKSNATPSYLFTGRDRSSARFPNLQSIMGSTSRTSGNLLAPPSEAGTSQAKMRVSQGS